ncbi:hypothetical protein MTO96_018106 [Rhipicephalus appendiculatus]
METASMKAMLRDDAQTCASGRTVVAYSVMQRRSGWQPGHEGKRIDAGVDRVMGSVLSSFRRPRCAGLLTARIKSELFRALRGKRFQTSHATAATPFFFSPHLAKLIFKDEEVSWLLVPRRTFVSDWNGNYARETAT